MPVCVRWSASATSNPEELYENPYSCKLHLPPPLPSLLGRAGISRAFLRLITQLLQGLQWNSEDELDTVMEIPNPYSPTRHPVEGTGKIKGGGGSWGWEM